MLPNGITELIDAFLDADGDTIISTELKAWLREDQSHVDLFVQHAFIHQQLRESLAAELKTNEAASSNQPLTSADSKPIVFPIATLGSGDAPISSFAFILVAFCVATAIAGAAFYAGRSTARSNQVASQVQRIDTRTVENTPYVARLVKVTNCLWASTQNSSQLTQNSQLDPGETLDLLEGVAEIKSVSPSGAVGKLILEGPVSLMLTSQGVPSLQYGKLSISINDDSDFKALNTPLGCVIASHNASFGVISYANRIEIHVFSGDVKFDVQLYSPAKEEPLQADPGTALMLSLSPEGTIAVQRGVAKEDSFITGASLSASHLNITESYVAAVKHSNPIAYWCFERLENGCVPNEMSVDFPCRIGGPIRWKTSPSGNRSAEFGLTTEPGLLVTDGEFKNFDHGLTIEFWLKPAYFQTATIFSLDKFSANKSETPLQGVMVELTGPLVKGYPVPAYRYRFLHRSPPGSDIKKGVSCFSEQQYEPRRWQHVAVVKDGDEMRLFVDGKLRATGEDSTTTAENLHVLMGQLYPFTKGPDAGVRPFAGELDEVAIYDRPLDQVELNKHVNLVRRESPDPKTW